MSRRPEEELSPGEHALALGCGAVTGLGCGLTVFIGGIIVIAVIVLILI